jgi:hypothetical protein
MTGDRTNPVEEKLTEKSNTWTRRSDADAWRGIEVAPPKATRAVI